MAKKTKGGKQEKNLKLVEKSEDWKSVSVVNISDGEHKGTQRITVTMYCPKCGGDVPISMYVPRITRKLIHIRFHKRGKCESCGKFARVEVPQKPTVRWKELADAEIKKAWYEERYKYIPKVSSSSSNRKGRKKAMTAAQRDVFRQYKYDSILKMAS